MLAFAPDGLTPAQVRHAYGFDQVSFPAARGRRLAGDGRGQTIAIVSAYRSITLLPDFKEFNRVFGLPDTDLTGAPILTQVTLKDSLGRTPPIDTAWAGEAAMDAQWAHAIAPRAKILLVEAASDDIDDLVKAVDYARRQPGVVSVSMSWGTDEWRNQSDYAGYFYTPKWHMGGSGLAGGVTFVASAGDDGAPATWPATTKLVVAVGGTTLSLNSDNSWKSETAWASSGGGASKYEGKNAPDVAYNANPLTGFSVYDTAEGEGWYTVAGTSAGAPQWAALYAIVNQGRAIRGLGSLDGSTQSLAALYQVPSADFHDIVTGSNGYRAKPGYDLVTGRGTPIAHELIADLVPFGTKTFARVMAEVTAEQLPPAKPFTATPFSVRPIGAAATSSSDRERDDVLA